MTTARELPPHGTYARANGSPGYRPSCNCDLCTPIRRSRKKHDRVNRQLGRAAYCDSTAARQRISELRKTMGCTDIAAAVNTSAAHIREIASGRQTRIRRTTHNKIMSVRPSRTGGLYIDATGTVRRLRALQAIGHTIDTIAAATKTHKSRIQPLIQGQPRLRQKVADRVKQAYEALAKQPGTAARPRNRAAAEGWAPPGAWDEDTIDDPNAHAEWTGYCGTDRGWWIHRLERLPMCPPCEAAHDEWKAAHQHLEPTEYMAVIGTARGSAFSREAGLADDARELMRISGLSVEHAAERLGVTKGHLQQAMRRHPEYEAAA